MPAPKPAELDSVIWADYVKLRNQAEVGQLHDLPQQRVSDAISRYLGSIPAEEKTRERERIMDRYERVYQAWADKADTSTRAANVVIRTLALQMHLRGLEPKELHIEGEIQHEHHDAGPTLEQLLERWQAQGKIQGEITRTDGGPS
jgi:ubiquinone biosynthesis protein UbiJ